MAAEALATPGGEALLEDNIGNIAERRTIRIGFNLDEWRRLTILRRTRHDGKMLMKNANESAKIRSQKQ